MNTKSKVAAVILMMSAVIPVFSVQSVANSQIYPDSSSNTCVEDVTSGFRQSPGYDYGNSRMLALLVCSGEMDESTFRSLYSSSISYDGLDLQSEIEIAKAVKARTISFTFFKIIHKASANGDIAFQAARKCGLNSAKQDKYESVFRAELSDDAVVNPSQNGDDVRKAHNKAMQAVAEMN